MPTCEFHSGSSLFVLLRDTAFTESSFSMTELTLTQALVATTEHERRNYRVKIFTVAGTQLGIIGLERTYQKEMKG